MVPERDLLAVKAGADKAKAEYETSVSDYKQKLNDAQQELLKHKATTETLEATVKQLQESAIPKEKLDALTKERDDARSSVETFKNKTLELRRHNIVLKHKIPLDKVATKSLEELDMFEEALGAVSGNGGNYVGSTTTGGVVPSTKLEEAANELRFARELAAKRRSGATVD
jgi:chromosome segregation ATPase